MKTDMKQRTRNHLLFLALSGILFLTSCVSRPLSLWTDSAPAKNTLIKYVKDVTAKSSPNYIPTDKRVAVFDLDGTLFLETDPTYFDWLLFEHRVLEDSSFKPTEEQLAAAKAAREGKFPKLDKNRERMVSEAYRGLTVEEFDAFIRQFMEEEQPGFIGLKRGEKLFGFSPSYSHYRRRYRRCGL